MKRLRQGVFLLLSVWALSICTSDAQAVIVQAAFTGEVFFVDDPGDTLDGQISIGDEIAGFYTYESSTPDTYVPEPGSDDPPASRRGIYQHSAPPFGLTMTIGSFTFETDPLAVDFKITMGKYLPEIFPYDSYSAASYGNLPLSNGTPVDFTTLLLEDFGGSVISDDTLPDTTPDLAAWEADVIGAKGGLADDRFLIKGRVTSLTTVPEPSVLCLLGLGAAMLRSSRGSSRR